MALFKVKDDENGYQDTKNESSSPNRRKYDRDNPSTSDGSARLFLVKEHHVQVIWRQTTTKSQHFKILGKAAGDREKLQNKICRI